MSMTLAAGPGAWAVMSRNDVAGSCSYQLSSSEAVPA
jgi:hypothetical protein